MIYGSLHCTWSTLCVAVVLFTRTWLLCVRVFAIANPSVCRLSVVCNVHAPHWGGWNSRQYFFTFCTLAILWPPGKIIRRSSQGKPSVGTLNARGVASDGGPIEGLCHVRVSHLLVSFLSTMPSLSMALSVRLVLNYTYVDLER